MRNPKEIIGNIWTDIHGTTAFVTHYDTGSQWFYGILKSESGEFDVIKPVFMLEQMDELKPLIQISEEQIKEVFIEWHKRALENPEDYSKGVETQNSEEYAEDCKREFIELLTFVKSK